MQHSFNVIYETPKRGTLRSFNFSQHARNFAETRSASVYM